MFEYKIERKLNRTGKRYVFYATKNGKRFTNVNYARKYDARGVVDRAIDKYGIKKLEEMFAK